MILFGFITYSREEPKFNSPTSSANLNLENEQPETLPLKYCINYGVVNARVQVIEYFSFLCPHCITLFKKDFGKILSEYINTGVISFRFHPVPHDLPTLQAMICLEKLDESEKRLFLEAVFEEATPGDSELLSMLMITAMKVFGKPIPELNDQDFLKSHPIFEEIYNFIKKERILAVPTVEVNGRLYAKDLPDYNFIKSLVEE